MDHATPPPAPPASAIEAPARAPAAPAVRPSLPTLRDPADPLGAACLESQQAIEEQRAAVQRYQPSSRRG